jgi:hypothetical protein
MASFIATGEAEDDYWLVDGCRDFSILPANTITGWTMDLPIRLHVGVAESYGRLHMEKHLDQFRDRWKRSIPELIYYKLGHGASIFNTDKPIKKKLQFGTTPKAFLFLEKRFKKLDGDARDEYLSLVSFYPPKQYQIENPNNAIAHYDSGNLRLCQAMTKAAAEAAASAAAIAPPEEAEATLEDCPATNA